MMERPDYPLHSILEKPWQYQIIGLNYQNPTYQIPDSFIQLTLKRNEEIRHLHFEAPVQLFIEEGFPQMTSGLCFWDVSQDGLQDITILVDDFEASPGKIHFWAKSVREIKA